MNQLLVIREHEIMKCKVENGTDSCIARLHEMQQQPLIEQAGHPQLIRGFKGEDPPNDLRLRDWWEFGRRIRRKIHEQDNN